MNSYEKLNDETKAYLNKAMDIYYAIKDKVIEKKIYNFVVEDSYTLSKLDKKIVSLYIASFLVNGNLKDILDEYDDIKVKDLFSFINISDSDIKELEKSEYSNIYNRSFEFFISEVIDGISNFHIVNEITPEVIYSALGKVRVCDSGILNDLLHACDFSKYWICDHPSFKQVIKSAMDKGSLKEKNFSNDKDTSGSIIPTLFGFPPSKKRTRLDLQQKENTEKDLQRNNSIIDLDDEKIWDILDIIQKKFIGQETAAEQLFYNIINNQQLSLRDDVNDGERSIIFIDGPTGTGKTAITREITDKLDIPFTASSATNYSSTGYIGGNITDTLKELYKKANGDLEKAQKGIIVFDEFDKIAYSRSGGLEMKKAVQQQLLDFMGGGKYNITVGEDIFDIRKVEFDTSKLTFICLGALSDLRAVKTEKKQSLGFGSTSGLVDNNNYSISPQDLINLGLERELVGRFNTYLHTEEYSKSDLLKILKESTISPLIGFEKWISSKGKKLEIDDGVYEAIADAAYELNTGARSLQTIMNNIRTHFLKEVLRGKEEVIHLDLDTVVNINKSTFNRKGRV